MEIKHFVCQFTKRLGNAFWGAGIAMLLVAVQNGPEAFAQELDAFWVHGSAASLATPTPIEMRKNGDGALLILPAGAARSVAGLIHIPLPTPVVEDGNRSKLQNILVQFRGIGAVIDRISIWDGKRLIHSQPVSWTGDHLEFGAWTLVTLPSPPEIQFGVNVTLYVRNSCSVSTCPSQSVQIASVGGDFTN